jgi:hypothetical protein
MTTEFHVSGCASGPQPEPVETSADLLIMLPVFNDWTALRQLLVNLDRALHDAGRRARVLIVDDGSTISAGEDHLSRGFEALWRVDVLELRGTSATRGPSPSG